MIKINFVFNDAMKSVVLSQPLTYDLLQFHARKFLSEYYERQQKETKFSLKDRAFSTSPPRFSPTLVSSVAQLQMIWSSAPFFRATLGGRGREGGEDREDKEEEEEEELEEIICKFYQNICPSSKESVHRNPTFLFLNVLLQHQILCLQITKTRSQVISLAMPESVHDLWNSVKREASVLQALSKENSLILKGWARSNENSDIKSSHFLCLFSIAFNLSTFKIRNICEIEKFRISSQVSAFCTIQSKEIKKKKGANLHQSLHTSSFSTPRPPEVDFQRVRGRKILFALTLLLTLYLCSCLF